MVKLRSFCRLIIGTYSIVNIVIFRTYCTRMTQFCHCNTIESFVVLKNNEEVVVNKMGDKIKY